MQFYILTQRVGYVTMQLRVATDSQNAQGRRINMHTLTAFIDTIFETATEITSNKAETVSSRKGSQFEVIASAGIFRFY